ncbi:hypothetical protein ACIQ7D_21295 [Streptomyces sp. NPDC096310]
MESDTGPDGVASVGAGGADRQQGVVAEAFVAAGWTENRMFTNY